MANQRSSNTTYVDSTGVLTTDKNVKIAGVILTATAANAVLVLQDSDGATNKLNLRLATSGDSQHFDFSQTPIHFANGVKVSTLTNAIATVVYTSSGG